MKNINITRNEAIYTLINLIQCGDFIPMVSLGNGGVGFQLLHSTTNIVAFISQFNDTDNFNFRVVPEADIAEDFYGNVCLADYDTCVEFFCKFGDNPFRAQFLLWFD